jgi:hypothetical protein
MKRRLGLIMILIMTGSFGILAQKKHITQDLGGIAGGAYYFGDLNPEQMFYSMSPDFGVFYRLNLNPRYSIRTSAQFGWLRANGADHDFELPELNNASFSTAFLDWNAQFEFNFLSYVYDPRKKSISPYFAAGIGMGAFFGGSNANLEFVIPVDLGVKVKLTEKFDLGLSWGFRKTFTDQIDNWTPADHSLMPGDVKSFLHNNDWYSIVGIFASYKIFYKWEKCEAYW